MPLTLLVLLGLSCAPAPEPGADWPSGALIVARTAGLARLLGRLAEIEGTPLASAAERTLRALPDCDTVEGRAASGNLGEALAGLRCRSQQSALAGLERERSDRDLAFALPIGEGAGAGKLVGTLVIAEDGGVRIALQLPPAPFSDARALLLPGPEAPGPEVLSGTHALLHTRIRPAGGIDLASLVARDGQGQRLFRLKSRLFAGAVLDGTWEAAIYPPAPGGGMSLAAVALGVSERRAAVAAIEAYIRDLQTTWPVTRSRFAAAGRPGACLLDLKILPEFAPCYVAGERALVLGWNPESLREALGNTPAAVSDLGEGGGLVVKLSRLPDVDAALARAAGVSAPEPQVYPWNRLVARGRRTGERLALQVELQGKSGT